MPYPSIPLHPYQARLAEFVERTPGCALFLPVGAGKTRTTLSALLSVPDTGSVLVIAPKPVARSVWTSEAEALGLPLRTVSLVEDERGKTLSKKAREERLLAAISSPAAMYLVNRELVARMERFYAEHAAEEAKRLAACDPSLPKDAALAFCRWPFPTVVIDESQSFKSPSSERFRALKRVRPSIRRMILLSGTPAPNGLLDLWSQLYLMDGGARLGRTMTEYRTRWFHPTLVVNNHPVAFEPNEGADAAIHAAISDICVSMDSPGVALPPLSVNDVRVSLSADEMDLYRSLKKDMVLDLDGASIEAANAAVLTAKLSQMASGTLYDEEGEAVPIHSRKLEMLPYIIGNAKGPVLIAYHFRCDKDRIIAYLAEEGVEARAFDGTQAMVDEWNADAIPAMLIQPAAAGHGINLQKGSAADLVFYTVPWNLEHYIQTIGRLHRQGQARPVTVHRLLAKGTIDPRVAKVVEEKDSAERSLLEAVKRELSD